MQFAATWSGLAFSLLAAASPEELFVARPLTAEGSFTAGIEGPACDRQGDVFAARDMAWQRRVQSGRTIDIAALEIGPATILHMPGELCVGYQLAAQQMRPDQFVCMAAYGDLGPGYIAMKIAYSQGGYETTRVSRVAPGVEDILMAAMRELLEIE